jgi:hypothetical protein
VVGLFPAPMRAALPMGKQYFCTALSRAAVRPRADRAIAAGILDGDALAGETDTAAVLTVMALEEWLAGAQERGAAIPGVCTASPRPTLAGPVPAATGPGAGAATTTNPRGGAP